MCITISIIQNVAKGQLNYSHPTKRPRNPAENRDVQWFVKGVGHLVLKVLGSHCGVKHKVKREDLHEKECETNQEDSQASHDFTASDADIGVDVERLTEMEN